MTAPAITPEKRYKLRWRKVKADMYAPEPRIELVSGQAWLGTVEPCVSGYRYVSRELRGYAPTRDEAQRILEAGVSHGR